MKNLTEDLILKNNQPTADGSFYKVRDEIIYYGGGNSNSKPHKSSAIVGLTHKFKENNQPLPSKVYFSDGSKSIAQTFDDLENVNLGTSLYLLNYEQHTPFTVSDDLKAFYIQRLTEEKFKKYEAQFNEIFN